MSEIFLKIVNMSISASYLILAVVLLRLALKKAPKWISVALFAVVAIRLICPFTVESVLSLIPSGETVSPDILTNTSPGISSGIPAIDNSLNPVINDTFKPEVGASVNPMQVLVLVASVIWLVGAVSLIVYALISYLRIKHRIATAVLVRRNIYKSENVASPFVLGLIKPRIYLPFNTDPRDEAYIIAHEEAHIRRRDYVWKPLGYLLLTLHWFNPFVWLGYILLCRDIESACDEKVIKELGANERADYSEALLTCSVKKRLISVCPLAFGETGVKGRIKSVLNYKKPAFWIIVIAIIAGVALAACFLTNPLSSEEPTPPENVADESIVYYAWKGNYTSTKHKEAVMEYISSRQPTVHNSENGIYIKANARIKAVTVRVFSAKGMSDEEIDMTANSMIAPMVEGDYYAFVDIGWLNRIEESEREYTILSYLVTVRDENNEKHHYYFRVDYRKTVARDPSVISSLMFDIDGDGKEDMCQIVTEAEGLKSYIYYAIRDAETGEVKYRTERFIGGTGTNYISYLQVYGDKLLVVRTHQTSVAVGSTPDYYKLSIDNGELRITYVNENDLWK
ncbi:MAG: transcriptional regulator [Clostridia bacterium]|nr:transcriptional regulator [Clostridia bacterium]